MRKGRGRKKGRQRRELFPKIFEPAKSAKTNARSGIIGEDEDGDEWEVV